MLDSDTKRRIDTARDILVGKVPDPKSQVEQITIALIYKFMDDMDAESEELGGARKFFTGDFARYGWAKLMRSGLGGHETLNLYAEAIARMPENPGIPLLFRDIFKNAFLPYRDPETLRSFLKVIDEFSYDHSERLGDAFEYLLSVLGSQGDAGQFRTPRHIIDFIVAVVDPKKNETILDPACGTAGFLISAYKHILERNTGADGVCSLTPDERAKLAQGIRGYDISPDMVRLSLVNLYLHNFQDPHIVEYDTLTSQERWNETADVILANPPFMSPKGGIKPHTRFSVQSKRSEVLFVDYMAEHLNTNGRAGIIVPEGVIFQSQGAYKDLRKMLIESSLVAVVSLPAGVFNPYSGVKTSILILDKSIARQSTSIGFFKVENDGYGLGAQRREIAKNDLPQVQMEVHSYLEALRRNQATDELSFNYGLIVPKEKIAENGDYNLSGERYREGAAASTDFPLVTLGEVCAINPASANPAEIYPNSAFNYIDISCVENETGRFLGANSTASDNAPSRARRLVKPGDVLVSTVRPNLKAFALLTDVPDRAIASTGFAVLRAETERLLPAFLIRMLRHDRSVQQMIGMMEKGAYPSINQTDVEGVQIPLPPLDVQKEIVAEIEGYQKVIDGARAVLDNYRPRIPIHPDWPIAELGEVCDVRDGTHDSPKYVLDGYPLITSKNLRDGYIDFGDLNFISRDDLDAINKRSKVDAGDLLMPMIGTIGNPVIADTSREFAVKNVALIKFPAGCQVDNRFLKDILDSAEMQRKFDLQSSGSTQRFISLALPAF
jgi:type I restriction enzyme M protein